jgi:hypothetical protein
MRLLTEIRAASERLASAIHRHVDPDRVFGLLDRRR